VLDGLFHRAVVLTEADGDCQFYAASLDAANEAVNLPFSPGDVLFLPVGGKSALSRVSAALRSVAVPLVVIADLDLLNNRAVASDLVRSLGGEWEGLEANYKTATQPLRSPRYSIKCAQVLELVRQTLEKDPFKLYDSETEGLVQAALRSERSRWLELKDVGMAVFKGSARSAAESLLNSFDQLGLILVRDGELERLAPQVASRKGTEWLRSALSTRAYADKPAQEHIARVATALAVQMGSDQT
jgi:hypothetical protein